METGPPHTLTYVVAQLHPSSTAFESAAQAVRGVTWRTDLVVGEIRPPANLAPNAIALTGDVRPERHGEDSDLGTGRFILLHDEAEPDAWRGPFRVVCFAQAPLEPEIGVDPLLADVAWSWLVDALEARGAQFDYESGTATIVNARGFGELAAQGDGAQLEIRASWTPLDRDFSAHAESWGELLCLMAGLPPVDAHGVAVLHHERTTAR